MLTPPSFDRKLNREKPVIGKAGQSLLFPRWTNMSWKSQVRPTQWSNHRGAANIGGASWIQGHPNKIPFRNKSLTIKVSGAPRITLVINFTLLCTGISSDYMTVYTYHHPPYSVSTGLKSQTVSPTDGKMVLHLRTPDFNYSYAFLSSWDTMRTLMHFSTRYTG